jgi:hypothetical protein
MRKEMFQALDRGFSISEDKVFDATIKWKLVDAIAPIAEAEASRREQLAYEAGVETYDIEAIRREARIDELERNKLKVCICDEAGVNACDALWNHRNNIDRRIAELKSQGEQG